MMNLNETISHILQMAEGYDECVEISTNEYAREQMRVYAASHKQLAAWLTELKNRREVEKIEKRSIEKCDKCSGVTDCPLYYPWLKE